MRFTVSILPLLISLFVFSCRGDKEETLSDASQSLENFEIAKGFQIELFAAEPLIADPVAMEVDEHGNVYVVEMHGYPLDLEGSGKIKLLKDTDEDGLPDESIIFADSLILPTGIMRWKEGVIVTDPPQVYYFEDQDQDGQADIRETLLTGFALSNPQHNLNTPVYGLDNWIYLAHESFVTTKMFPDKLGDEGKDIVFPDKPEVRLPKNANGRNVRFHPDTYQLEALSGASQFGQTFDAWGHHVLTSNATHLFHEVIDARYLERNPHLLVAEATTYLPAYGQGVEVFPVTQNPEHQLLTDVGTITSACGVTWYLGDLFPEQYQQVTFVAEPVHNLVHADVIQEQGATFLANRLLEKSEFLASRDSWFRPVNFYTGPDGALYVIDYYRQIIEHPEWMSEEMLQSGQLYEGTDQGRIYRITPKGTPPPSFMHETLLGKADDETLVQTLTHDNIWWRRHAQRMLIDRKPQGIQNLLDTLAVAHQKPTARVHALWTLQGLGWLQEDILLQALQDETAGVRENAILLAELHLTDFPALASALPAMATDQDPKVRFQLLCTLGFLDTQEAGEARQKLLMQDLEDEWMQLAALSGAPGQENALFQASLQRATHDVKGMEKWLYQLSRVIGHAGDQATIREVMQAVRQTTVLADAHQAACLQGLAQGLSETSKRLPSLDQEKRQLTAYFSSNRTPELRQAALSLLNSIGFPEHQGTLTTLKDKAKQVITDQTADASWRSDAIYWLTALQPEALQPLLPALIQPQEPELVQQAAILALKNENMPVTLLLEKWQALTPDLRNDAVTVFFTEKERMLTLLEAVDEGTVDQASLGWRNMVELMNSHDDDIRSRSRALLAGNAGREEEVIKNYQSALTLAADPVHGKAVFEKVCASCHQIEGSIGKAFGPDLSTIRNRSPASIMEDILLPNKSIADGYEFWELQSQGGKTLYGIISAETANALTLKDAAGQETTVSRTDIAQLQASTLSAMPTGLDQQMSQQDMADLLAFLKKSHRLAMD